MLSRYVCSSVIRSLVASMAKARPPRSVWTPRASISTTRGPMWICGTRSMPCASSVRWSMRASCPARSRARFACRSHDSRHSSSSSLRFQSRFFWPKPSGPMSRVVSRMWACGFSLLTWCRATSATMPRFTNSARTNSRTKSRICSGVSSQGIATSTSRQSWASLRFSAASTPFQSLARSCAHSGALAGVRISVWSTPPLRV